MLLNYYCFIKQIPAIKTHLDDHDNTMLENKKL